MASSDRERRQSGQAIPTLWHPCAARSDIGGVNGGIGLQRIQVSLVIPMGLLKNLADTPSANRFGFLGNLRENCIPMHRSAANDRYEYS